MKFYAGIGSRETPSEILTQMTSIAAELEFRNYVLRSGGAGGADSAFEEGVLLPQDKRIYLPWANFNGRKGIVCGRIPSLRDIAMTYHPCWHRLSEAAKKFMTRNTAQVLGYHPETQRSEFIVCWTPGGMGGGGTGQAIRIARAYQIPVYDLAVEEQAQAFREFLGKLK